MKKRKLISTLCMVLIVMQFQSVIAFATEENSGNSESDALSNLEDLLNEQNEEEAKQKEEEAKKEEAVTANISPLLVDPVMKNKFVYQNRINDKVLVYRYTGTRQELEDVGVQFETYYYILRQTANLMGGRINYDTRTAYFIDSNITKGMPIIGGSVSTTNDRMYAVDDNGNLSEGNLTHNQNPKYKKLVNEIYSNIDGDILYPRISSYLIWWELSNNYDILMGSKYKKFLADLAVKYKICDDSETTTMKARLTLSVFYDVYNGKDGLVTYNTDDKARISRLEFYTLFCKYIYGTSTVLEEYKSGYPAGKEFMNNFENEDYAPYYDYVHLTLHRASIPDFKTTKQALKKDITKYEVMSLISAHIGIDVYVSYEEEYNKYKNKSILDYCSDIKKSQIMTYKEVCKKYFKGESATGEKLLNVCLKNKIIMDYEQAELVYLIDKGILTVDSQKRLNLFNKVTYNQAITYLMNYSTN